MPSPPCAACFLSPLSAQVSARITGRFGSKVRLHFLRPSPTGGPPLDVKVVLTRGRRASFADSESPPAVGAAAVAETTTFAVPPGARPGELAEGPDEPVRGPCAARARPVRGPCAARARPVRGPCAARARPVRGPCAARARPGSAQLRVRERAGGVCGPSAGRSESHWHGGGSAPAGAAAERGGAGDSERVTRSG